MINTKNNRYFLFCYNLQIVLTISHQVVFVDRKLHNVVFNKISVTVQFKKKNSSKYSVPIVYKINFIIFFVQKFRQIILSLRTIHNNIIYFIFRATLVKIYNMKV